MDSPVAHALKKITRLAMRRVIQVQTTLNFVIDVRVELLVTERRRPDRGRRAVR